MEAEAKELKAKRTIFGTPRQGMLGNELRRNSWTVLGMVGLGFVAVGAIRWSVWLVYINRYRLRSEIVGAELLELAAQLS